MGSSWLNLLVETYHYFKMKVLLISLLTVAALVEGLPQQLAFPGPAHTFPGDLSLSAHPNAAHTSILDPSISAHPNAAHTSLTAPGSAEPSPAPLAMTSAPRTTRSPAVANR